MATNLIKFPLDLDDSGDGSGNPEHHHMMVFRIYSNSSSSLTSTSHQSTDEISWDPSPENALLEKLDSSRSQDAKYQGEQYGGVVTDTGAGVSNLFTDTEAGRATIVNKDAIYLPFPQTINMADGWNWESTSFQKSALGEAITGNATEAIAKTVQGLLGGIAKVAEENAEKAMWHSQRRVVNPRKETMFNEPSIRTFSFEFDFAPRNAAESAAAQKIIQLFKYHASPELEDNTNALYRYPSEFQMYFVSNGAENSYIAKIDRCACTGVSVNYTNANMWSAFKQTGAPTHLKLSLEFTELSLQSRNRLMQIDGLGGDVRSPEPPPRDREEEIRIGQENEWDMTSHIGNSGRREETFEEGSYFTGEGF